MPTPLGTLPTNQPAPIGNLQRIFGAVEGSATWPAAGTYVYNGIGVPLSFNLTPTRRCFWVVQANLLVLSNAANWNRFDGALNITPADRSGRTLGARFAHAMATGVGWVSLAFSAEFSLEANVAYQAYLTSAVTDNVTQYHLAQRHLNFFAYTIGEGYI